MSAALIEHFDLLAASLGGVAKLRELILSLAVRGKLVPQDPNGEPASELLKKIRAEKDRLVKEGKIKRDKALPAICDDEKPYELPEGWEWARLSGVGYTQTGGTPDKKKAGHFGTDIPFIKPGDLYPERVDYNNEGLSFSGAELLGRIAPAGTILMVCIGTIGKCNAIDRPCSFNQQINSVSPLFVKSDYLLSVLRSTYFQAEAWSRSSSTTISILNKGNWESIVVPVPPAAEQSRIVAKVEELMALCDKLEAEQGHAARVRGHWVEAALDQLAGSGDADEFGRHWQHLAENFDTLFTTPESIARLDATLLQLAVRGKLVPQDPKDEPASELLKKIRAEKDRLIAEGKIKRDKALPPISEDEKPYELPEGWEWGRFADLILASDAGWSPSCDSIPRERNKWGVLKVSAVTWGEFRPEENKALPDHLDPRPECEVHAGDFLLSRANTEELVARSVVAWDPPTRLMLSDKLIRLRLSELVNKKLFCVINNSDCSRLHYIAKASGTSSSMKNVSREVILTLPVPVPPAAEQSRIVAKVEELMALTASLKARLAAAQTKQSLLAEALVADALAC